MYFDHAKEINASLDKLFASARVGTQDFYAAMAGIGTVKTGLPESLGIITADMNKKLLDAVGYNPAMFNLGREYAALAGMNLANIPRADIASAVKALSGVDRAYDALKAGLADPRDIVKLPELATVGITGTLLSQSMRAVAGINLPEPPFLIASALRAMTAAFPPLGDIIETRFVPLTPIVSERERRIVAADLADTVAPSAYGSAATALMVGVGEDVESAQEVEVWPGAENVRLDTMLSAIDPRLVPIRQGGWEAVSGTNPERVRHSAASARALLDNTLRILVPQRELPPAQDPKTAQGARTKDRIRALLSDSHDAAYVEALATANRQLFSVLSSIDHHLTNDSEDSAYFLLLMMDGCIGHLLSRVNKS